MLVNVLLFNLNLQYLLFYTPQLGLLRLDLKMKFSGYDLRHKIQYDFLTTSLLRYFYNINICFLADRKKIRPLNN